MPKRWCLGGRVPRGGWKSFLRGFQWHTYAEIWIQIVVLRGWALAFGTCREENKRAGSFQEPRPIELLGPALLLNGCLKSSA